MNIKTGGNMKEKRNIIRIVWMNTETKEIASYRYKKPHTFKELRSYFKRYHLYNEPLSIYRVVEIEII